MKYTFSLLLLLSLCCSFGQDLSSTELAGLEDEELLTRFNSSANDTISMRKLALEYISRGKTQNDSIKVARGFDRLCRIHFDLNSLKYTDSIIKYTANKDHRTYPSMAYTLKGVIYNRSNLVSDALDSFIIAYDTSKNEINKLYNIRRILAIYLFWGNPKIALKKSFEFQKYVKSLDFENAIKTQVRREIEVTDSLIQNEKINWQFEANDIICMSYMLLNRHQDALKYLRQNEDLVAQMKTDALQSSLRLRKAELDYYLGNYYSTTKLFEERLIKNNQVGSVNSYFYLGAGYYRLGEKEKGLNYLLKADSINEISPTVTRELRELFEILKSHHASIGNRAKEVEYLKKYIRSSNRIIEVSETINPKYRDDFETPKLLAEKEELIAQLEWEKGKEQGKQWVIGLFLAMSIATTGYYFWRQRQYKLRFQAIMDKGLALKPEQTEQPRGNGISARIIEDILKHLEIFEREHQYTDQDVSLQKIAKSFGTNSSYLSKVINLKKDKNFSQYISELRITFAVNELQNNPRFRKYTIKAIAQEVGFGNAQSFSKAFYARTGLHPSYFIRNLNKQEH